MEWSVVEAGWAHYKNMAKARWTRITADELDAIGGRREQLAHRIHEIYGLSIGTAQMQLESWQGALTLPLSAQAHIQCTPSRAPSEA